jgi:hypothetical protein
MLWVAYKLKVVWPHIIYCTTSEIKHSGLLWPIHRSYILDHPHSLFTTTQSPGGRGGTHPSGGAAHSGWGPKILLNGSTVVTREAVSLPVAAGVIPLTGVINRYAKHIWRWSHIGSWRTSSWWIGGAFSFLCRATNRSVVTVSHPDKYLTHNCRLCILTGAIHQPTLARGWCGRINIRHGWAKWLGAKVVSFKFFNRCAHP